MLAKDRYPTTKRVYPASPEIEVRGSPTRESVTRVLMRSLEDKLSKFIVILYIELLYFSFLSDNEPSLRPPTAILSQPRKHETATDNPTSGTTE